jgi:hypothetical protein
MLYVGARVEDSNATGFDGNQLDHSAMKAGAAYQFAHAGSSWVQQHYIKASNTDAGDQFGYYVAVSADGSTLAIGADQEASNASGINGDQSNNSMPGVGVVYVISSSIRDRLRACSLHRVATARAAHGVGSMPPPQADARTPPCVADQRGLRQRSPGNRPKSVSLLWSSH